MFLPGGLQRCALPALRWDVRGPALRQRRPMPQHPRRLQMRMHQRLLRQVLYPGSRRVRRARRAGLRQRREMRQSRRIVQLHLPRGVRGFALWPKSASASRSSCDSCSLGNDHVSRFIAARDHLCYNFGTWWTGGCPWKRWNHRRDKDRSDFSFVQFRTHSPSGKVPCRSRLCEQSKSDSHCPPGRGRGRPEPFRRKACGEAQRRRIVWAGLCVRGPGGHLFILGRGCGALHRHFGLRVVPLLAKAQGRVLRGHRGPCWRGSQPASIRCVRRTQLQPG